MNRKLLGLGIAGALIAGSLSGCVTTSSSAGINVFGEDIMKTIIYSGTPQREAEDGELNDYSTGFYYRMELK